MEIARQARVVPHSFLQCLLTRADASVRHYLPMPIQYVSLYLYQHVLVTTLRRTSYVGKIMQATHPVPDK